MSACVTRLMVIFGAAIVAAACGAMARGLPWTPDLTALQQRVQRHEVIRTRAAVDLEEFLALIDQGAIVIDARSAEEFERSHLAAWQTFVLNVPGDAADQHVARLMEYLGSKFVIYCMSDTCDASEDVCDSLVAGGFDPADIFIYVPGWEGIVAAELETASGPEA